MNAAARISILSLAIVTTCFAQDRGSATTSADTKPIPLQAMPQSLEIQFALSALPRPLRAGATVYVLDPAKGYRVAHEGSNGQHCFVERTDWKRAEFRDDIFTPICYDGPGAKSQMQVYFDTERLRATGTSPSSVKTQIESGFATGTYKAPDRAGFSYMVAPVMRVYVSQNPDDKTVMTFSMPHIMYYAPNITPSEVGKTEPMGPYPVLSQPGPLGYFIQSIGATESAKIRQDESALLSDLCKYRSVLCLDKSMPSHTASGK